MKDIKKGLIILFIALGILILPYAFEQKILLATPIQLLQEKINFLKNQVSDLMAKLFDSLKKEPDHKAPILANLEPEHHNITDTEAILTWKTDELSDSVVFYLDKYIRKSSNKNANIMLHASSPDLVVFHKVKCPEANR